MEIYETPNKIKIIDKSTAIYVLEKVQEAIKETMIDNYVELTPTMNRVKTPQEMLETLENKLQNILNEIKGGNE